MKTIKLNGEDYILGSPAICIGVNLNCFKVVSKAKLGEVDGEIVLQEKHFDVAISNINDFYVDTTKNRKMLKKQINGN